MHICPKTQSAKKFCTLATIQNAEIAHSTLKAYVKVVILL